MTDIPDFNSDYWNKPDVWLAAIILNSNRSQVYGKIKNDFAILERVPQVDTEFRYLDIVKVAGPTGTQMYRDDEIDEYNVIEIVQKSKLKTYSYQAILPTSSDYFNLLDWFTKNGRKTEMEFSMNFNEKRWLNGRCSAENIEEAKSILISFIREEKGSFRDKFFRLFDNSLYSRKFRNLQEH